MDGEEMILCILDEINKWANCSLRDTINTYRKFLLEGTVRKGLFDMFSSPAEVNGRWNDEALELWSRSQMNDLQPNGTTKSRIHAMLSNPLEGITGMYDEYGDADPNRVFEFIMKERKTASKKDLLNVIRGYPLDVHEAFGSFDNDSSFDNAKGIIERKQYTLHTTQVYLMLWMVKK